MKKTIGIIGGMGPEASCELMRSIITLTPAKRDQDHARILMDCNGDVPDRTRAILYGEESPVPTIVSMAHRLEGLGAELLLIPCNTSHCFFDEIAAQVQTPILHMLRITAEQLRRQGIKKAGILATDGTIRVGIYQKVLAEYGIEGLPPQGQEQEAVMSVIYDGIKGGQARWDTTALYRSMDALFDRGAETMVLGCTELPLAFVRYGVMDRPYIDPARELAKEAIRQALGVEPREE